MTHPGNTSYHARNKDDIGDIVDQALQETTMIRKETGHEIIQDIFQDGSLQQSTVNMARQDNSASVNTAQDEVTIIGFHKSGTRKIPDISGNCDIKHAPDQGGKFYCQNETHLVLMPFDSQMALTRHVLTVHRCP